MQYADSITKSFLSYGNPSVIGASSNPITDWQDPTYMGFRLQLNFSRNDETDLDDLPHGLFCGFYLGTANEKTKEVTYTHSNKYSTYNYLINRGEYKRAEYIRVFEQGLDTLIDKCPWYFVKVTGLADAWKIDSKNNWRGKDKKITIETLESIDMKMTYLLDSYRKAVFDANWMRWAVPDHMRYFKLNVIVSEVRNMKIGPTAKATIPNAGEDTEPGKSDSKIKAAAKKLGSSVLNNAISPFAGVLESLGTSGYKSSDASEGGYGLKDPTTPWSAATFIKFSFSHCEIDIAESPTLLETVGIIGDTISTSKLVIKTGVINESNTYGLLGAILEDTLVWQDYGKDGIQDIDFSSSNSTATAPGSLSINPLRETTQTAFNSANGQTTGGFLSQLGDRAIAGTVALATDAVNNAVNGFLLGNVYDTSAIGLLGAAENILNNPAGAVEGLLTRFSSPSLGAKMAQNVELTGIELSLISKLIGQTKLDAAASTLGPPGKVNLAAPTIETTTLGKQNLTPIEIPTTPPGKTMLSSAPSSTSTLGSTTLDGVSIDNQATGKVDLLGPEIPATSPQKSNLSAFATAGSIPSKAQLRAPNVNVASAQNVSLEGAIAIIGNPGEADLSGAPAETSALGKADLTPPSIPTITLGKVKL